MRAAAIDYQQCFERSIARLKSENRYRSFADLERDAARFPLALWRPEGERIRRAKSRSGARTITFPWAATRK